MIRKQAEYYAWAAMSQRCTNPRNPKFKCYGAVGVSVCERWQGPNGFRTFLSDMGPRPDGRRPSGRAVYSLDRYPDPSGNYEPGNCRWATDREQTRNYRHHNRHIVHNGCRLTLVEWAEFRNIQPAALRWRLNNGWPVGKALGLSDNNGSDS